MGSRGGVAGACIAWARGSARSLGLSWLFAAASVSASIAGCSSGPPPQKDVAGNIAGSDAGPPMLDGASTCTGPYEGCTCPAEGAMTACPGAKIQVGNRTICPPGVRICRGGVWGACLATDVGAGLTSQTQDYSSTCAGGTKVRWGLLTLDGQTPGNSTVGVGLQTATTSAGLDAEAYQLVAAFDASAAHPWGAIDVGAVLAALGQDPGASFLRVTMLLSPASDGTVPTVQFNLARACIGP